METNEDKDKTMEITERHIDLGKVIKTKNERLYRLLPRFVVRLAERLLHVKDLNRLIYKYRDDFGPDFARDILRDLNIEMEIVNADKIPLDGNPIFVGNHPLGGVDGMALISEVGQRRGDVLFPVNDILMFLPGLKCVFVPVNKFGRNTDNVNALENAFAGQNALLFFPAGLCSRKKNGVIRDLEWKKTFIKKARKYRRDIVPVYIDAHNSDRFYRFANIRKKLGIKFNFDQLLLPSEMFRMRNGKIRMVFGTPIPYTAFDNSKKPEAWAAQVREHVYGMAENPELEFEKQQLR